MGCDIHGIVEIQYQGAWKSAMNIGALSPRNYRLFGQLFGVRGRSQLGHHYGDRGFPQGVDYYTTSAFCRDCDGNGHPEISKDYKDWLGKYGEDGKEYCMGCCDWHSPSFITMQEIESHWDQIMGWIGSDSYDQEWRVVFDTMRFWANYLRDQSIVVEATPALATGKEDTSRVRLIVWFDN